MTLTRIVQLTDLHLYADPDARFYDIPTRELLQDVVAHVEQNAGPVDHLVVTGDHTNDDLAVTYEAVRDIVAPWLDRAWFVPGNHEDRAILRATFPDRISGSGAERINFSFAAGESLCLGLDTHVPGNVSGHIGADQIAWVEAQLAEHDPATAVLFMHHPPILLGLAWIDRIGLAGREQLQDLILRDARIRLVCCGHVHHESSHHVGAAEVVTTPSTGLQFSPTSDEALFVAAAPGYRIIELDGDSCMTRVVRLPEARYAPSPAD
jgi:3',5'-cyclic-AMP phosphodiesterase